MSNYVNKDLKRFTARRLNAERRGIRGLLGKKRGPYRKGVQ